MGKRSFSATPGEVLMLIPLLMLGVDPVGAAGEEDKGEDVDVMDSDRKDPVRTRIRSRKRKR
jgi:hypothetical protein